MQYTVNLKAGQWARQATRGAFFLIITPGVAGQLEVRLLDQSTEPVEEVRTAGRGFRVRMQAGGLFQSVEMRAAVDTTAEIIITESLVDFDFLTGAQVSVAGQVDLTRGAPGNPLAVTAVTVNDTPATAVNNLAAVAVGAAGAALVVANAARRELRFTNIGPDPVALGAPGLTWAQRAVILYPGDTWVENRAANLAWSAITDAAGAATVGMQQVLG